MVPAIPQRRLSQDLFSAREMVGPVHIAILPRLENLDVFLAGIFEPVRTTVYPLLVFVSLEHFLLVKFGVMLVPLSGIAIGGLIVLVRE